MSLQDKAILGFALAGAALAAPASALTVHTAPFIVTPTATVGFEGLGAITAADGVNSYGEDGILVEYVGGGLIWSYSQPTPDGIYSWYPDGGGYGYTRISFEDTTAIEFLTGSGWFDPGAVLAYDVLLDGVSVGSGIAGLVPSYGAGWVTYGFSGATFDEVRLQVAPGITEFSPGVYEAGAFDAIVLGEAGAVPEPASWGLMILGFGALGGVVRRTTRAQVRFA